jgi:translation elongation factor EF-G
MKTMFGKRYPNCVKNKKTSEDTIQEFVEETVGRKNSDEIRRIQQMLNKKFDANLDVDGVLGPLTKRSIARFLPSAVTQPAPDPEHTTRVQGLKKKATEQQCPECGGPMFSELMITEKQDACYYKVKSRYKVWPSAYASGALVQCRKKGAANWGNKSK